MYTYYVRVGIAVGGIIAKLPLSLTKPLTHSPVKPNQLKTMNYSPMTSCLKGLGDLAICVVLWWHSFQCGEGGLH